MGTEAGVVVEERDGHRSTSAVGREAVAAALTVVDPDAARVAGSEPDWRHGYPRHFHQLSAAALAHDEHAADMARAGLAAVRAGMAWCDPRDPSGADVALWQACVERTPLTTRAVRGDAARVTELVLPYRGEDLRGDAIRARVDAWVRDGVIEPGAADAVRTVLGHPEWLDARDLQIAVLGASSEVGPLVPLLAWGATVLAVARPAVATWEALARTADGSAGTLLMPMRDDAAGVDILTEPGDVAPWLVAAADSGRPLVVGDCLYGDGATNLRLAVASDVVTERVRRDRPDTALAFLATPTDTFVVPQEVVEAAWDAYGSSGPARAVGRLTRGRLLAPQYPDAHTDRPGITDAIVPRQGPNYLLAKRIHRWRAAAARADGAAVSLHVAPPTATRSVIKNRALAAAYAGAHRFGIEVFAPATASTLMAALLVHDLRVGTEQAPGWRAEVARACHGGLWRSAFQPRSALGLAALWGSPSALSHHA